MARFEASGGANGGVPVNCDGRRSIDGRVPRSRASSPGRFPCSQGNFRAACRKSLKNKQSRKRRAGNLAGRFRQSAGRIREGSGMQCRDPRGSIETLQEHGPEVNLGVSRGVSCQTETSPRSGRAFGFTGPSRDRPSFASCADRLEGDCGCVRVAPTGLCRLHPQVCRYAFSAWLSIIFGRGGKSTVRLPECKKNPALPRAFVRQILFSAGCPYGLRRPQWFDVMPIVLVE